MPLTPPRTLVRWRLTPALVRRASARSRRAARRALGAGLALFAALTVALGVAAETVKPEWRDPEYGHRLNRARRWQAERPDRPLVLVVGSSRAQMGVAPAAMGFPDEPGAPLVYNFGYRAGTPVVSWLLFARALDDGIRPRAVLFVVSLNETRSNVPAEVQFGSGAQRLSHSDIHRLAPYTSDPEPLRHRVGSCRRNPWCHRGAVVSEWFPALQTEPARSGHRSWVEMDQYGFCPAPVRAFEPGRPSHMRALGYAAARTSSDAPLGAVSDRAIRGAAARCRAEGIAFAVAWAPESPEYRACYTPSGWAGMGALTKALTEEVSVPVFPAPGHLDEGDFVDGFHLTPDGAAKYSRWLADTHLKPWLAVVLK